MVILLLIIIMTMMIIIMIIIIMLVLIVEVMYSCQQYHNRRRHCHLIIFNMNIDLLSFITLEIFRRNQKYWITSTGMKYERVLNSYSSMCLCVWSCTSLHVCFRYVSNEKRNDNTLIYVMFILLVIFRHQRNLKVEDRHCGFSLSCSLAEAICSMQTLKKVELIDYSSLVLHGAFYQRVAEKAASSKVSKSRTDISATFGFNG